MKHNKIYILLLLLPFAFASCDDWFAGALPKDKNLEDKQFSSESDIIATLNGIYRSMSSENLYGGYMTMTAVDLLAHYYYYDSSQSAFTYFINMSNYYYAADDPKAVLANIWKEAYVTIFDINNFIHGLQNSDVIPEQKKKILLGESYGLRAFIHLDIYRLFGPQALPYNTDYEVVPHNTLPVDDYFRNIMADIDTAKILLAADPIITEGIIGTDTEGINDVPVVDVFHSYFRNFRLNYYAVRALEARALINRNQSGDHAAAAEIAKSLIALLDTGTPFHWTDTGSQYLNDYIAYSEVIFGIYNIDLHTRWKNYTDGTRAGSTYTVYEDNLQNNIFGNDPHGGAISQWPDIRSQQWVISKVRGDQYVSTKFLEYDRLSSYYPNMIDPIQNLQPLIRMSEMYYIYIEELMDEGRYDEATAELCNFLHHRGWKEQDTQPLINSASYQQVYSMLETEYYKEFYAEGQTFFFLKRTNRLGSIFNAAGTGKVSPASTPSPIPLPENEVNF
ncbi:MAG: RagB/SusD family nutrient uptake outer membrane protein [Dysgonamonadaceae bacterium]|jgi:hypothetical protein|nr:RagB/SusD family nutrient uptake outer membrane protein [Dysgonamonadaceae bacterium]